MALTGLRSGELVHLLLPEDIDLEARVIRVRNKPDLGWRTKTRNERDIPIVQELADVLRRTIGGRRNGLLFLRRRFINRQNTPMFSGCDRQQLAAELARRSEALGEEYTRFEEARIAKSAWRDAGAIKETTLRVEFMQVTEKIGLTHVTCPKLLRHMFATSLQEANVDPLIRQELMGHAPGPRSGNGLGMTTVYTHTRDATRRSQLEKAMVTRKRTLEAARI